MTSLLLFAALLAQQPPLENATPHQKAYAGSVDSTLGQLGNGPLWAGYSEKIIPGQRGQMCWGHEAGSVKLEGPTALVVLVRIENGKVDRVQTISPDCRVDAGGLPFYWIDAVPPAASVAWLKTQVTRPPIERTDSLVHAIALHDDSSADAALQDLASSAHPQKIREKAILFSGVSRGSRGVAILRQLLENDPDDRIREKAVMALCLGKQPAGLDAAIAAAKNDKSARVRGQALFWLAQKAGEKEAAQAIAGALASDPDRQVKEQAVFALKQLPDDQGVPLLIVVAKNNADPAVRKKAMFWLGQSKDPRALDFFTQVLK